MLKAERYFSSFFTWMSLRDRDKSFVFVVFASTVIAALVAHLFCWTNTLFGHDSLLVVQMDQAKELSLGRPFQHFYLYFRGLIVAPWLIGVLGTLFLSLSNLVICKILDIRSRGFIIVFCCIMTTSPFITLLNATYITWYDVYMLALLLACTAVLLSKSYKSGWIWGTVLICLSMGLYSAYIQVAIVLFAGACLIGILKNKNDLQLSFFVKTVAMFVVGGLLYLLAAKGAQFFSGVSESSSYNSLTSAFHFNGTFIQELVEAWLSPFLYLLFPETHIVRASGLTNLLLIIVFFLTVILICRKNGLQKSQIALTVCIIVLMPLFSNVIGFATANNAHSLMIYSYYLFYGILLACLEIATTPSHRSANQFIDSEKERPTCVFIKTAKVLSVLFIFLLSINGAIYANQVYLKKELEYQSTLSIMTGFEERLDSIPDYTPGETPVVCLGSFADNPYYSDVRKGFPPSSDQQPFDVDGNFTEYSVGLKADISLYGPEQIDRYYRYILGCPIKLEAYKDLSDSKKAQLKSMPLYPQNGSIVYDGEIVLIKLS